MEAKRLAAAGETAIRAEARIGAELKAAQERGELATQDRGRANIPNGVRNGNTVGATLPEIGLTRKQAMEAKRLAAAGETAILAEARIGAELKAAQERGELATQDRHPGSVPNGNTAPATLPEIGLTRKQAMEAKRLAAAGEPAIRAEVQAAEERGELAKVGDQDRVRDNVPGGNIIPATLSEIGLTGRQAMEAKRLAAASSSSSWPRPASAPS